MRSSLLPLKRAAGLSFVEKRLSISTYTVHLFGKMVKRKFQGDKKGTDLFLSDGGEDAGEGGDVKGKGRMNGQNDMAGIGNSGICYSPTKDLYRSANSCGVRIRHGIPFFLSVSGGILSRSLSPVTRKSAFTSLHKAR
jgi:hypothetical protein